MEKTYAVTPIGRIFTEAEKPYIELQKDYARGLEALEGFSHAVVLWWFHQSDEAPDRKVLEVRSPYRRGPGTLGTFATRSPFRPNPIAMTVSRVLEVDEASGRLYVDYTDALDGSPVPDIKPYTPSMDRVEAPTVPAWCAHWPRSLEASEEFDWENEFNF